MNDDQRRTRLGSMLFRASEIEFPGLAFAFAISEIAVKSDGIGRGSTFTVRLPIAAAAVDVSDADLTRASA